MDRLSSGLCGQKEMVVEEQHLASVWGNLGVEVLSADKFLERVKRKF